ncbi:MAG: prenyltransferase/squalene oxidase repeat-containing protein [Verrucomicrobiota bacterium]
MKPSRNPFLFLSAALSLLLPTVAFTQPLPDKTRDVSLAHEVQRAIDRGLEYLAKQQTAEGHWAPAEHPAITALAVSAIQGDPSGVWPKKDAAKLKLAYQFILKNAKEDGSIHANKLMTYNTSLSLMALVLAKDPEYRPAIEKARHFLIATQFDLNEKGKIDSPHDGGFSYGDAFDKGDMSQTLVALQAMYFSKAIVKDGEKSAVKDLNWEAALKFIQNCQDLPKPGETIIAGNKGPGGFTYGPLESKAPSITNSVTGKVSLRTYGSMTYAGLLSYIYADLKKDDPRVTYAVSWLENNYTLKENPAMGAQGLYYYYHLMAKALNTYGLDELKTKDGQTVNWRKDLALHLMNQQQTDGSWINQENARWWEKEPVLVTAYTVMALEFVHRGLQ